MHFTKMNGAGNDFIIIEEEFPGEKNISELSKRLCDRHFGIGADGVLLVKKSDVADAEMVLYNSDGSLAEMCGNGIRCFAKYIRDHGFVSSNKIRVMTGDGIKQLELVKSSEKVTGAKVNMGFPKFKPEDIPVLLEGDTVTNRVLNIGSNGFYITSLNIGVPHTVIYTENIDDEYISNLGRRIEKCEIFPKGTNVNFVRVQSRNEFQVRTWERGAGLTMACGTGACASQVANVLNDKTQNTATAHLKGGDLLIEWAKDGCVFMTGPCEYVYNGDYMKDL